MYIFLIKLQCFMVYIAYLNEKKSFLNYLLEYKSILIKEELLKSEYTSDYISKNLLLIGNEIIEKVSKLDNIYTCKNSNIYNNIINHLAVLINRKCINSDKEKILVKLCQNYKNYINNLNRPKITGDIIINKKLSQLEIALETINANANDYNKWYSQSLNEYNSKAFNTDKKYHCSECSICLNKGRLTKLSCGHLFHIDCIDKCNNFECPLCKQNFKCNVYTEGIFNKKFEKIVIKLIEYNYTKENFNTPINLLDNSIMVSLIYNMLILIKFVLLIICLCLF